MRPSYTLVTPPAELPLTLEDVRRQCRVDAGDDDPVLTSLLATAVARVDGRTGILGRALVTQTWRVSAARPDCGVVWLGLAPVQSITSVQYVEDGVAAPWAAEEWRHEHDGARSFIAPAEGYTWPTYDTRTDAVQVTFVAGYGAAAAVPVPIKHAMLLMIGEWYANRENSIAGALSEIPLAADVLLAPFKAAWLR